MKLHKSVNLVFLAVVTAIFAGCGASDNSTASFKIHNNGKETVKLQATLPDRVAKIHLLEQGIRTFPVGTSVDIGDSEIRVNNTRIEIAHSGEDVVTLNYVDSLGKHKTMMLGNGGTGFFHNPRSIEIGTAQISLAGNLQ